MVTIFAYVMIIIMTFQYEKSFEINKLKLHLNYGYRKTIFDLFIQTFIIHLLMHDIMDNFVSK